VAAGPDLQTPLAGVERDFPRRPRQRQQHDVNEDPYVLAARYSCHLPLFALFDRRVPLFTTTAIEVLAKRIWYRSLARVKDGFFRGAPPDASTTGSPPATRLPQGVVNMIITYLTHDTRSLLTCSLTSRSWYIAAVPHLHRTLVTRTHRFNYKNARWPKPLRMASKFGSLPFVTRLFVYGDWPFGDRISSKLFQYRSRRDFSALTNVRDLTISGLDVASFIPKIQQYFGQFSPTVRYLSLRQPLGSHRQIVFFIGMFPHLEDLDLHSDCPYDRKESGDLTLAPPFAPPFGGRLTATHPGGYGLAKTMVDLFGRVKFHHMSLLHMGGTQLLLYACANTLKTLKLDATGICGEKVCSKYIRVLPNYFAGRYSNRDLDLSRNESLRKLEIEAQSLICALRDRAPDTVPSAFRAMMSTVKSPAFSNVLVVYRRSDFYNVAYSTTARTELGDEVTWYRRQFEVFREMYKARHFRLVLWVYSVGDGSVRELERAVAAEKAKGGLPPELSTTYTMAAR